ncbi:MAG TPA: hypothetical protein VFU55_08340 [Terracidiphilus sp.]|nr:hypothetical protein [Terracidiphilus sp.]
MRSGDAAAADRLLPLLYNELHRLARRKDRPGCHPCAPMRCGHPVSKEKPPHPPQQEYPHIGDLLLAFLRTQGALHRGVIHFSHPHVPGRGRPGVHDQDAHGYCFAQSWHAPVAD